jgi:very-short-patch-repair endonuclease
MRESRTSGSVEGAGRKAGPYSNGFGREGRTADRMRIRPGDELQARARRSAVDVRGSLYRCSTMGAIPVSTRRRPFVAARAKELRSDQTPAEALLWEQLRRRRFPGHRFRRQHPMGGYIADFYCHSLRLVIEVDGAVHDLQKGYDAVRDAWFRAQGYTVLRLSNEKVLGDLGGVMQLIRDRVEQEGPELARACVKGHR